MNKKDTAKILAILKAGYPNAKIENAEATVMAWEMILGSYSAESVMKAVRLHMETSPFFPTPADIRNKIIRAEMIFTDTEVDPMPLLSDKKKQTITPEMMDEIAISLGFPDETDLSDKSPVDSKHWLE